VAAERSNDRGDSRPAPRAEGDARPVAVDRLTHEDVNDICSLYRRVWDAYRPTLPPELVKAWEPTPLEFTSWMEGVTYFAARRDGRMIGAIGCQFLDGACRLVNLAVDPDARRQGVATALANAALEWARHNNSRSIWVDALATFTGAAEMFKRLGFAEAGVLHRHFWGEDVRLLERIL